VPLPALNGAGVVAVVVLSPPEGKLFAVPEVRLLGPRVVVSAVLAPGEVLVPEAFGEDVLPLFDEEVVPVVEVLPAGAVAVVDGSWFERVVFVVVDPVMPVVSVLPLVGAAVAAPTNARPTASAKAREV